MVERDERERKEEEEIVNIRMYSDDFLNLFGILLYVSHDDDFTWTDSTRQKVFDIGNRVTKLNQNNKEFLDMIDLK